MVKSMKCVGLRWSSVVYVGVQKSVGCSNGFATVSSNMSSSSLLFGIGGRSVGTTAGALDAAAALAKMSCVASVVSP